jgi:hypothetical protein
VGRRHFRETTFAPGLAVTIAAEGACIEGDEEMLDEVAEMAATLMASPIHDELQRWVEGTRLLVHQETDAAVPILDRAIESATQVGMRWVAFEIMVTSARHLPIDHPRRASYVDQARAIAEETEAPGLSAWIDLMVG